MTKSTKKRIVKEIFIIGFSFLMMIILYFIVSEFATSFAKQKRIEQQKLVQELNKPPKSTNKETPNEKYQKEVNQILKEIDDLNYEFIQDKRFKIFYNLKNTDSLIGKYPLPDDNFCLDMMDLSIFHGFCLAHKIYKKDLNSMKNELFVDCYDNNYKALIEKLVQKNKAGAQKGYGFELKENPEPLKFVHIGSAKPPFLLFVSLWILFVIIRITFISGRWLLKNRNE